MSDFLTFTCRMPAGVRDAVKALAGHNHRSMNAELVHMLSKEPSGALPANALVIATRSGDQFQFRIPTDLHRHLSEQASSLGRSLNSEIAYRVQCYLHDEDYTIGQSEAAAAEAIVYRVPPQAAAQPTTRRVYVLPVDLVKRIHEYGYESGHPSEVAAVRELLELALAERAKAGEA